MYQRRSRTGARHADKRDQTKDMAVESQVFTN